MIEHSNIGAVERDTGISKDTLRMWERRYAFPKPARDRFGERQYPAMQVEKLRLIKQLMDRGHRPGKIIGRSIEDLRALGSEGADATPASEPLGAYLDLIKSHQVQSLRALLSRTMALRGLHSFIVDIVAPLNAAVGNAWLAGHLAIFEEHLYSELIQGMVRNAISHIQQQGSSPQVLLTSLPQEQHNIGLLMTEAVLTVHGASCISLGTQTPLPDILAAARTHRADIVGLSFSASFPEIKAAEGLALLRAELPPTTALWAGGAGALRLRKPIPGVQSVADFESMVGLLNLWRNQASKE